MGSLSPLWLQAQHSDSLFTQVASSISELPKGISDLEVDQEGNVFLLQPDKHKLFKYFKNNNYDSILAIGGKGIGVEGFNFPTKISVPNRQNIFLLDYMNRRLVMLNTNLKVIRDINFLTLELGTQNFDEDFLWPISFAAGPTGETYLLNQENLRIYKVIGDGTVERTFAGVDYGSGSLIDPCDLTINSQNLVFAVDSSEQKVSIFDLFGTYQYALQPNLPFRWHRLVVFDENLLFLGKHELFIYNLFSKLGEVIKLKEKQTLIDADAGTNFIYLLFENKVNLYRLRK